MDAAIVDPESLHAGRLVAQGKSQEEARITSPYIERERNWQNELVKAPFRKRIASFVLRFHKPKEKLRLLSTPGIHWQFEHHLLSEHRNCRFIGLEWTWGVIELGMPFMPGGRKRFVRIELRNGHIDGIESNWGQWLWVEAGSFLGKLIRRDKGSKRSAREFSHRYKRQTAFYLDFMSPLCAETEWALEGVQCYANLNKAEVPAAITLLGARDAYNSTEKRIERIAAVMSRRSYRDFEIQDFWTYTHHDIAMLTVLGLLKKKTGE